MIFAFSFLVTLTFDLLTNAHLEIHHCPLQTIKTYLSFEKTPGWWGSLNSEHYHGCSTVVVLLFFSVMQLSVSNQTPALRRGRSV